MKERYGTVYKGSQRLIDEESGEGFCCKVEFII